MKNSNYPFQDFFHHLKRSLTQTVVSLVLTFFGILIVLATFTVLAFSFYVYRLPDPQSLIKRDVAEPSKIFARNGQLLYEIYGETRRSPIRLEQMSPFIKQATIAVEDKDFYKHGALSLAGIARSIVVNYNSGQTEQGGSTITQQFVKNALLTPDRSFKRKISEIGLSIKLESSLSKDEILQLYLNEIPYGRNAYGIEAASQIYLGKSANALSLSESAFLAALPQAPSYLNPAGPNALELESRKNYILTVMREQNYISAEQFVKAKNERVTVIKNTAKISAPHFVFWIQNYLEEKYGETLLTEGGLKVYTTLDPNLQKLAEQVLSEGIIETSKKFNGHNGSLVATDPKTGQILAMVGSKDFFGESEPKGCTPGRNCLFEPEVNVATANRQPGSSFKPYAYVTAFGPKFGYGPTSKILDVPKNFSSFGSPAYIPRNYDGSSHGLITMRKALAGSLNVPAVRTLALVGIDNVIATAKGLGLTTPLKNCGLTLVLGGCEVKLVDHTAAFGAIANGGKNNGNTGIMRIENKYGHTLESYSPKNSQVVDQQAAYSLISIMTDNNARSYVFGAKSPLTLPDRPVAAKTGTTQDWHDAWTLGFTPQLAVGVWVGNNDGTLLKKNADAVFVAAPIWQKFMIAATANLPVENFIAPPGIIEKKLNLYNDKPAPKNAKKWRTEVYADYANPPLNENSKPKK